MLTSDQRFNFINTVHSLTMLNFSPVLSQVSQSEFFVMTAIDKLAKLNDRKIGKVSSIAESLHVSSPAISRTITTLENRGYVVRYIDNLNRRNTDVRLTELGHKVYLEECDALYAVISEVFDSMGEEKLSELAKLANELVETFEHAVETPKKQD